MRKSGENKKEKLLEMRVNREKEVMAGEKNKLEKGC